MTDQPERTPDIPEGIANRRFSEGQEEELRGGDKEHRGDFSEGQRGPHLSPERGDTGDYGKGLEERDKEGLPHEHDQPLRGDYSRGQSDR